MTKVSNNPQQGRKDKNSSRHAATFTKKICPVCKNEYLHAAKIIKDGKLTTIGLICPNLDYGELNTGYKIKNINKD